MRRELKKHEPALSNRVKLIFTDITVSDLQGMDEVGGRMGGGAEKLTAIECRLFTY